MDRVLLWSALALFVLAALAGGWRWGWLRGPAIVLLAAVALASSLTTVFFLYGGFAWTARGGGTLLLFVLPAAVLAWVSSSVLRLVWRSRTDSPPMLG